MEKLLTYNANLQEIEENEESGDKSYLVLSLEHAVSLLDNSFKLGLVTIKVVVVKIYNQNYFPFFCGWPDPFCGW